MSRLRSTAPDCASRSSPSISTSSGRAGCYRLAMFRGATSAVVLLLVCGAVAPAQQTRAAGTITSPKEQFGHDIGDDYFLVNYTQYEQYLKKLARESARMTVLDIGRTAEGRIEYTAIITSPENQ